MVAGTVDPVASEKVTSWLPAEVDSTACYLHSVNFQEALLALGIRHQNMDEVDALFNEMDLDNDGALDKEEFRQAIAMPSKLEQWTSTLQLPGLLASCFPLQLESVEPLRDIIMLSEIELRKVTERMCDVLYDLLRKSFADLKKSLSEMDRLADERQKASSNFQVVNLSGGCINDFFHGLTGRIGTPHPILKKGMEDEHCKKGGHDKEFTTKNYGVTTTPRKEYLITTGQITCPEEDMKDKKKQRKLRVIKAIKELLQGRFARKSGLIWEEVLAIVLYTGPMFQIYNLILLRHPIEEFVFYEKESNLFATTIHVMVSGVIKIARTMKLPAGLKLYRGLGGTLQLPKSFWQADLHGCRGYMEWGFLSTTSDKSVAVEYSGAKEGKPIPTVICVKVGSVDRGAKIQELSQYPQEVEYLWTPCTFLEPEGSPTTEFVTDSAGSVVGVVSVIQVRGSANLKAQTVEELSGQKKLMHLNAFGYMLEELQHELKEEADREGALARLACDPSLEGAEPAKLLQKLLDNIMEQSLATLQRHCKHAPEDFDKDETYRGIVMEMLEVKAMARAKLRCYLFDKSKFIVFYLEKSLRYGHRALVSFLRRKMEEESGESRRVLSLEICKMKNLVYEDITEQNEEGEIRLLSLSAEGVSLERLRLLIAAGADTACLGDALLTAAEYGQQESVLALIEVKADVETRDKDGLTALHLASLNGHLFLIDLLIDSNADVDVTSKDGATALFLAAMSGHVEVARALCAKNANVNAANEEGRSPLFWASWNGHLQVARVLIEGKAQVNAADQGIETPLHQAATDGHADLVKMLIEKNADVNAVNESARTPLMAAASSGKAEAVGALIAAKADVNAVDQDSFFPLYIAALNGHLECVRLLVESKAPIEASLTDGSRPLAVAASQGRPECLKMLLEYRADVNFRAPGTGKTALDWASDNGHTEIAALLRAAGAT